jgi:hypothetical protein
MRGWPRLRARYDERVRKTFEYFFLTIAGFFRARALQHWHLLLTPPGAQQPVSCRLTDARRLPPREKAGPRSSAETTAFDHRG